MAAAPTIPAAQAADPVARERRRKLSTAMLQASCDLLPKLSSRLDAIEAKLDDETSFRSSGDTLAAGTFQGSPEAAATLRKLSLLSPEELDAEATDPVRRMRSLVMSEMMAAECAKISMLSGKFHWAKQFMEHQRRCGDTLQKLRREAAIRSKSLPADWDTLTRWVVHDLKRYPEALEMYLQRMDQYEEGKLPRFEPEQKEKGDDSGIDVSEDGGG